MTPEETLRLYADRIGLQKEDVAYLTGLLREAVRGAWERAEKICENPYSDEVAALGDDEPSEVASKILNALIRAAVDHLKELGQ